MWYEQFEFVGPKNPGLPTPPPADFFQILTGENQAVPDCLRLTDELHQLLTFSDGGLIVSGKHELGYFSLQEIWQYYVEYGFATDAPCLMPVAFDGGGRFYAYDFRNADSPTVVLVPSGAVSYDDAIYAGQSLESVLNQSTELNARR